MPHRALYRRWRLHRPLFASRAFLLAALGFFLLMTGIGAIPGEARHLSDMVDDRVLHFTAYVVLSCLIYGAVAGNTAHRALRTLVLTILLGLLDESIQSFMPYRVADLGDLGYDVLAALFGISAMIFLDLVRAKRRIDRISHALRATPAEWR